MNSSIPKPPKRVRVEMPGEIAPQPVPETVLNTDADAKPANTIHVSHPGALAAPLPEEALSQAPEEKEVEPAQPQDPLQAAELAIASDVATLTIDEISPAPETESTAAPEITATEEKAKERQPPSFLETIAAAEAGIAFTPEDMPEAKNESFFVTEEETPEEESLPVEQAEPTGIVNVPPDEELFQRQYYSIGEVAAMFGANSSQIRYWENEFDILDPKKTKKGDRLFRPEDVKNLQVIQHLLRQRRFTIEGAKEYLKRHGKQATDTFGAIQGLEKLKGFLLEMKANLE